MLISSVVYSFGEGLASEPSAYWASRCSANELENRHWLPSPGAEDTSSGTSVEGIANQHPVTNWHPEATWHSVTDRCNSRLR